jgi:hypothetical protein
VAIVTQRRRPLCGEVKTKPKPSVHHNAIRSQAKPHKRSEANTDPQARAHQLCYSCGALAWLHFVFALVSADCGTGPLLFPNAGWHGFAEPYSTATMPCVRACVSVRA